MPVEKISKEVFTLVDNMIETMLKNDGIGLAATQVGSLLRLFVIKASPEEDKKEDKPEPMAVINPEIINQEGLDVREEGCLSFPELYLNIVRPQKIRIHGKNLYNERRILGATGLIARAIMHEIDHLNGVQFIERVDKAELAEQEKIENYLKTLSQNAHAS